MESNINQNDQIYENIINYYINTTMEEYQNNILVLPVSNHNKKYKKLDRKTWEKHLGLNTKKSKRFTIEI
jgi:hypothetical protein